MEKKIKVLLVEDDVFVSDVYVTKLTMENFEVVAAENGVKALEKLAVSIPDIILLDILMPFMDGKEFLKNVRAQAQCEKIPVVILTNLSQKEDVDEMMQMGANAYLIKSHFTPSEVVTKIKEVLGLASETK